MANLFENIIARGLAGGIEGSIEQFLAEEYAKKKAIAEAWGKGRGAVPTETLPSFLRAGWGVGEQLEETPYDYMLSKPPPDIPTQLSPLSKSGEADYRPGPMQRGYASIESPAVIGERKLKHKMISQIPTDPGTRMYTYLRNVLKWNEEDAKRSTEMAIPDVQWRAQEELGKTRAEHAGGVHDLWEKGEVDYNNWPDQLSWHGILLSIQEKYLSKEDVFAKFRAGWGKGTQEDKAEQVYVWLSKFRFGQPGGKEPLEIQKDKPDYWYAFERKYGSMITAMTQGIWKGIFTPEELQEQIPIYPFIKDVPTTQRAGYLDKEFEKWMKDIGTQGKWEINPATGEDERIPKDELKRRFIKDRAAGDPHEEKRMMDYWGLGAEGETGVGSEDAFIQEIQSKNITTIHWDKIAKKYPKWDIDYIKQQLGM